MDGNFYTETYTYREGRILLYKRPNSKNFQCRLRVKGIKGYTVKSCDTSNLGKAVRHYYATQRLLEGVQVYDLAKNMGTSVKQIENHYGHVLATQKTNELILGAGISSWQEYQESDEYKLAQEEIKADQEEIAKSKEYIRQLQSDMESFKRMSSECDRIAENAIKYYDEYIENALREMDEKALKQYRSKLVKLAKKHKNHPEINDESSHFAGCRLYW